jgi:predicted glycosyltransferase
MQDKGHKFTFIARDKEVLHSLLLNYNIKYTSRGKGKKSFLGKLIYMFYADFIIYKVAKRFNPDLLLSFGSPFAAQVAFLIRKPHIAFDDTDHAFFEHLLYIPFTKSVLTPTEFAKDFGSKHIRFRGFMELCYLHPNYFKPDKTILNELGVIEGEKYVLMRFISWSASHDLGHKGLSDDFKKKLIYELKRYAKIFISSEKELPDDLKQFQIKIKPEKLHSALYYSTLYIGEGGTTANECACLGVPNILVNSLLNSKTIPGIHLELARYGLQILFETAQNKIIELGCSFLKENGIREKFNEKKGIMINDKIDVTAFMVWYIDNFPESDKVLIGNPGYQLNFR